MCSPQPFAIKEVQTCNKVLASDHIFLDDKGFFANVLLDVSATDRLHLVELYGSKKKHRQDNQYESLETPYLVARRIKISYGVAEGQGSNPQVQVDLALPPTLGKETILTPSQAICDAPKLEFVLERAAVPRFQEGLKSRGLVSLLTPNLTSGLISFKSKLVKVIKSPKLSLADRPASLEMDASGGRLVGKTEVGRLRITKILLRSFHNVEIREYVTTSVSFL